MIAPRAETDKFTGRAGGANSPLLTTKRTVRQKVSEDTEEPDNTID